MTRRVLITGGAGLLGAELIRRAPAGLELHATERRTPVRGAAAHRVELAEPGAARRLLDEVRPDLVVHTAYGREQGERDIVRATREVAAACAGTGAGLVHMSTDALLDGEHSPYDERADPAPVHEYGRHKAQAEADVRALCPEATVVRTSLIVGTEPPDGATAWVLGALREPRPIPVFVDELRCPIAVGDLAAQIWELCALPAGQRAGVWNLAGPEALSRWAIALLVAHHAGLDPAPLRPTRSADSPAPRPRDLRLLTARADGALRTRARPISVLLAPR